MIPEPPRGSRLVRPLVVATLVVLAGIGIVTAATRLGSAVGERFGAGDRSPTATVPAGLDVEVEIPRGAGAAQIARILADAGVVESPVEFELAVRAAGAGTALQAGRYRLVTGMAASDVVDLLRRGPQVVTYDITVREGLRLTEILDVLADVSGIDRGEFETALTSGAVRTGVVEMSDTPDLVDWEGLLFPDTYRFSENATAVDILTRLARTMEQRLDEIDWTDFEAAGFSRYEGIVIASLIESEVRVAEERPLVSSVIRNRLDLGMPLQIDATVLYALGTREVSAFDRDVDSPYNTYRVTGLPPTPIAAPGRAALEAAAAPADTEYLYYVLSSPDGRHTFSRTLEEHQAAVEKARRDGVLP